MIRMNKQIDLESMTRIIMEFERQNDIMEAKEESVIDCMCIYLFNII